MHWGNVSLHDPGDVVQELTWDSWWVPNEVVSPCGRKVCVDEKYCSDELVQFFYG